MNLNNKKTPILSAFALKYETDFAQTAYGSSYIMLWRSYLSAVLWPFVGGWVSECIYAFVTLFLKPRWWDI